MNFDLQQIISAFIAVFVIIDILGSIPIIMGIKEKNDDIKPLRVCLISFAIFILFLYGGEGILRLFKVDFQSFAVAGSIIIFVYAVEMVLDMAVPARSVQ